MDLDLAQVRAFVVSVERGTFGAAAAELYISQQALAKRVRRLERVVGEPLFARHGRGVEPTEAGRRFLPHARRLLADADEAAAALRGVVRPLRVDVWSEILSPLHVVREAMEKDPGLALEISARRDLRASLVALRRREIDAAFGRVHGRWPAELDHRPVVLTPYQVAMSAEHPLAGRAVVRPGDLRETGLWFPFGDTAPELLALFRAYCSENGIPPDVRGVNLGLDHILTELRNDTARVAAVAANWSLPAGTGLRTRPIKPVPYLLWSVCWRRGDAHPQLAKLLELLGDLGRTAGWLAFDPAAHWLPAEDRALL